MGKEIVEIGFASAQSLPDSATVSLTIPEDWAAAILVADTQILYEGMRGPGQVFIQILPIADLMVQLNASDALKDFFQGNYSIKPCIIANAKDLNTLAQGTIPAELSVLTYHDERAATKKQFPCPLLSYERPLSLQQLKQALKKPEKSSQQAPQMGLFADKQNSSPEKSVFSGNISEIYAEITLYYAVTTRCSYCR